MAYDTSTEEAIRQQAGADGVTHFTTGVAVTREGKILVVRRIAEDDDLGGEWELPGGGVDEGETIGQGAARELLEETGLVVDKILSIFEGFDYTTTKKPKARQTNFKVTAKPGDIVLDASEHDDYRWIAVEDIPGLNTNPVMQACLYRAFSSES
jgi:8-oxo-dGTP diphosphatase